MQTNEFGTGDTIMALQLKCHNGVILTVSLEMVPYTVFSHIINRVSLFDGMERWNGTVEWNGMEWNDHAHRARCDDLYPMCLRPSTKKQQVGKPVVSEVLKKTGSI